MTLAPLVLALAASLDCPPVEARPDAATAEIEVGAADDRLRWSLAAPRLAVGTGPLVALSDWAARPTPPDLAGFAGRLVAATDEVRFERSFRLTAADGRGWSAEEAFSLRAAPAFGGRLRVVVPLLRLDSQQVREVRLPRRDGRLLALPPGDMTCASYVLGGEPARAGCVPLALPLVHVTLAGGGALTLFADPLYTATFAIEASSAEFAVAVAWVHPADRVPVSGLERRFHAVRHPGGPERSLDAFFAAEAEARAPAWTDPIALVYFDYLSEAGQGWFRDLDALAARLDPGERARTAVALHGWYDRIGAYAFDAGQGALRGRWRAQPRRWNGGVEMTVAEVRRRLARARELGFRTLLYYADGLVADSTTAMGARSTAELGRTSWNGPEVEGELRVQNPADPVVRAWFHAYTDALLAAFGDLLDGLVWDETFWVRPGAVALTPAPAHADVAMMTLVRELAHRVARSRPGVALLVSDAIGHDGIDAPPYALMAHGTFQDSECNPWAWSYGLFPNWRKPLWSVQWGARIRLEESRLGTLLFGAPMSLANGWADDLGPAEMPDELLDRALAAARFRMAHDPRPGWLEEAPERFLARPLPGERVPEGWRLLASDRPDPPDEESFAAALALAPDALRVVDAARVLPAEAGRAWAEATVVLDRAETLTLTARSHGPLRVLVDGRELLEARGDRRLAEATDLVEGLELGPGPHRLLVRFHRTAPGFGFALRFERSDAPGRGRR